MLPIKGGFEVLQKIKNDSELHEVSVVMVSGARDLRYVKECAPLADDCIENPISLEDLVEIVSHPPPGQSIVRA